MPILIWISDVKTNNSVTIHHTVDYHYFTRIIGKLVQFNPARTQQLGGKSSLPLLDTGRNNNLGDSPGRSSKHGTLNHGYHGTKIDITNLALVVLSYIGTIFDFVSFCF